MCGITGFIGHGDRAILEKMTDSLKHRGPDDEGFYLNEEERVGLGHRRLSIIDLSPSGRQPMSNEDDSVLVIFNGEIYNFLELKKELIASGHKFKSNTDTEVIVHLYEDLGEALLRKINGMFAFAIWDKRNQKLFLARDRLGKKPLYYSYQKSNFVFASELKALSHYPYIDFLLDNAQLKKYFFYDYIPCPHTPYKDIFKLGPGEFLLFQGGAVTVKPYWTILVDKASERKSRISELKDELDVKLRESVKRRLICDVPLGVFLSGGIDSSAIAWYSQELSNDRIKTFSIDFIEKGYCEGEYAKITADSIGSEHNSQVLFLESALDIIPHVISNMDEPMADASILPTYLLSKFTREHVTIALSGDGADELFGGYQTFQAEKLYNAYKYLPTFLKRFFLKTSRLLPSSSDYLSFDFKLKKFLHALDDEFLRHQNWLSTFNMDELNDLFVDSKVDREEIINDIIKFRDSLNAGGFASILAFYQRFYMQERVLVKVDRASMLESLEVRSPFLDYEIVEWANKIPLSFKLRGFNPKYILKELMKSRLPQNIISRPKKGFSVPLGNWFRGGLRNLYLDLLRKDNVEKSGILNYDHVLKISQDHFLGRENNGQKMWSILVFLMWQNNFD